MTYWGNGWEDTSDDTCIRNLLYKATHSEWNKP